MDGLLGVAEEGATKLGVQVKFDELAVRLDVLSNSNRLRLLHQLLKPRALSEIDLPPETVKEGENPHRPISRQAVQRHLEKLSSIGLISTFRARRDKALVELHTINYPRLFALVEEMRALGQLRPLGEVANLATIATNIPKRPREVAGPRLLIVRGLQEGTAFSLTPENASSPGRWVMGRKRGLPVCLDYDPFVSAENSEFVRESSDTLAVRSLPASRNGTQVNWELLKPDEARRLEHGDVVGVGKTLLLFRRG